MRVVNFFVSIIFYFVGMAGLFAFCLWCGDLLPVFKMHGEPYTSPLNAFLVNASLIAIFGIQHTVMARQSFKSWWKQIVPPSLERGFYIVISGLLCFLIIWQWKSIEGYVWQISPESVAYKILYGIYFFGILFLVSSSFILNHFELFGLQQTYLELKKKAPAKAIFKEILYYKIIRHPIYLGFLMIIWSAPNMSMTHLSLSVLFTIYILIGSAYEEKDLAKEFGSTYSDYQKRVPKLIPFTKLR